MAHIQKKVRSSDTKEQWAEKQEKAGDAQRLMSKQIKKDYKKINSMALSKEEILNRIKKT